MKQATKADTARSKAIDAYAVATAAIRLVAAAERKGVHLTYEAARFEAEKIVDNQPRTIKEAAAFYDAH